MIRLAYLNFPTSSGGKKKDVVQNNPKTKRPNMSQLRPEPPRLAIAKRHFTMVQSQMTVYSLHRRTTHSVTNNSNVVIYVKNCSIFVIKPRFLTGYGYSLLIILGKAGSCRLCALQWNFTTRFGGGFIF